jgi:hypothetical protein
LDEKFVSRVKFEIEQIDRLLLTYAPLLEQVRQETPDLVEVTALGSVLHSFYNGLENIFLRIAKEIDQLVPSGKQWHRDLLNQMTNLTSQREPVFSIDTVNRLADYLAFRHFYRHSYSFFLEWSELQELVDPLAEVWEQTKAELGSFLDDLE